MTIKDISPPPDSTGTNSESSDPLESDFSDEEVKSEEESEESEEESEEEEAEEEEEDDEAEDEEEEDDDDDEDEEEVQVVNIRLSKPNGLVNGVKKTKGYELDDFEILKTIGESFEISFLI